MAPPKVPMAACLVVDVSEMDIAHASVLGTGASGTVYSAVHMPSGKRYALKLVKAAVKAIQGDVSWCICFHLLSPHCTCADVALHEKQVHWHYNAGSVPRLCPESTSMHAVCVQNMTNVYANCQVGWSTLSHAPLSATLHAGRKHRRMGTRFT